MAREYKKHNYVVRCGGNVKAYMTAIEYPKGHPPVYTYGTQDPKKAKKAGPKTLKTQRKNRKQPKRKTAAYPCQIGRAHV